MPHTFRHALDSQKFATTSGRNDMNHLARTDHPISMGNVVRHQYQCRISRCNGTYNTYHMSETNATFSYHEEWRGATPRKLRKKEISSGRPSTGDPPRRHPRKASSDNHHVVQSAHQVRLRVRLCRPNGVARKIAGKFPQQRSQAGALSSASNEGESKSTHQK